MEEQFLDDICHHFALRAESISEPAAFLECVARWPEAAAELREWAAWLRICRWLDGEK